MAFDIFFAGSQAKELDEMIAQNNYCRLFSQLGEWGGILQWVENIKNGKTKSKLMVDSGAYSAKTQGIEINLQEYVDKINKVGEYIYCFANLDVIPNSSSHEDVYNSAKRGWENFMYIQTHCKYPNKCMFVYHRHDPTEFLDCAIAYYKNNPNLRYFALGGLVALPSTFDFVRDVCEKIKRELPYVKIHLFGYTRLNKLPYFNADSTDSTTWLQTGALGYIITPWGNIRVSEKQRYHKDSIHSLESSAKKVVLDFIESKGYKLEELETDYKKRMMFNIQYFVDESKNINYITTKIRKKKLI